MYVCIYTSVRVCETVCIGSELVAAGNIAACAISDGTDVAIGSYRRQMMTDTVQSEPHDSAVPLEIETCNVSSAAATVTVSRLPGKTTLH